MGSKLVFKGFIYEAWDINTIKQKYGNNIQEFLGKNSNKEVTEQEVNSYITSIYNVDPSSDKKYLGAITQWVLSKRPEDLETQIKDYLIKFKKLLDLNPGKFGGISKNITKGKLTLDQFKELVNQNSALLGTSKEENKISDKVGDFKKVGENQNYVCYLVDEWVSNDVEDKPKHFCFTGDVDWCVKYQEAFDEYEPPYYYFLDKSNGKEFALMHIDSLQIKNIRDAALDKNSFLAIKDIVVNILSKKLMPYEGIEYDESDFKVIIENVTPQEFNSIFYNIIGNLCENSLDKGDFSVINKLFETYPASELWQKTLEVSRENKILNDVKWLSKNYSHRFHLLSDAALKGLLDEFGLDEEELFKHISNIRSHDESYNRKMEIGRWLIADEYVRPIWQIRSGREILNPLEIAVFGGNIAAVEELLKMSETDPNTYGLDSEHSSRGTAPIQYIANLTDYEHNEIFNMLLNDPRTDVNVYREEFDKTINDYIGSSLLDSAIEDRKASLIKKGAKTYEQLENTGKAKHKKELS